MPNLCAARLSTKDHQRLFNFMSTSELVNDFLAHWNIMTDSWVVLVVMVAVNLMTESFDKL
jgi:hypothetical protein